MAIGITKTARAICGNVAHGLPVCKAGWNGMCHSVSVCTEQMCMNDSSRRTPEAEALYQVECMNLDPETAYYEYLKIIRGEFNHE